ncbi:MAG TPA: ADOP family duplicated permease [Candidatus Angelobacter sp.]
MIELLRRIYYLLNRSRLQRELENDMAVHREMLNAAQRKDFGNPALLREQAHAAWGWGWLDRLGQDLRFGARMLRKSPALAFTAIVVLALGIGVNVTAFNIIDVFYFKALPVRDPHSLVRFTTEFPEGSTTEVAYPAARFYAEHNQVLSTMIALRWTNLTLGEKNSKSVRAGVVSANYFSELGSSAAYGRLFLPQSDGAPDAPPVVVLGYGFWQRNFGGDASAVGRTIQLNQHPATIIGVTSFDFAGLDPEAGEHNDVWLMIHQEPYFVPGSKVLTSFNDRDSNVHMWGRLKPGVTVRQAQQALLPLADELVHQHPDVMQKGEHLRGYAGASADQISVNDLPVFVLVVALFGLILVAACGNLGSLLLGHAVTREREISIRLSLGATRGRIVRQLMTESLLLALAGTAAGLFASWNLPRIVVTWAGGPGNFDFTPGWRTIACAFVMGLVACVVFGLPAARQLARQRHRASRVRNIFMAAQVTASCVLLIISALLVRALDRAVNTDPGFDYRQTLTVDPQLYSHAYNPSRAASYLQEAEARIQQIPGVDSAALVLNPPLGRRASIQGIRGRNSFNAYINQVGEQYFRVMGIPLLQGRIFNKNDHNVAIVSEAFARKVWPGKDPLRQVHKLGSQQLAVIGVVGNAHSVGYRDGNSAELYLPPEDPYLPEAVVLVKTGGRPQDAIGPISEAVRAIDPVISPDVQMVKDAFKERVGMSGKITGVVSGLGALALALAVIGLFGVVAYNVSQRTREIGIRIALGATPSWVVRSMVSRFVLPLGIALAVGVAMAAGISIVLRTELFGVSNLDPLSYLAAVLLLAATASAAVLIPARRALKVDPMVALRCE